MAETTLRYKDIDTDTRVGFNYIKQQFYVTNKEYTTYRNAFNSNHQIDLTEIKKVLVALNIDDQITDEELTAFVENIEYLHTVSFTLQDNGAYIHTLQFNSFENYPLTIDCEKAKLYIMNSNIIYDLTLNESPRKVRIPRILSFYKETLGLLISVKDMRYFYSLLVSYYLPKCYNQIALNPETNRYFYNNKFLLSNYNNTSDATYTCTYNPNNNANLVKLGNIVATDTTTNNILLTSPVTEEDLKGYNKVIIKGATEVVAQTEYSSDGEYTVNSIGEEETPTGRKVPFIKVFENFPFSYSFPYKECYVLSTQKSIVKMDSSLRAITLSTAPTDILVGDVILVTGAKVESPHETISCNGTYTVSRIGTVNADGSSNPNSIEVEEEIPTDFVAGAEDNAILIKEVFIGNITNISENIITLLDPTSQDLTNSKIFIHTIANELTTIERYDVSSSTDSTITVTGTIEDYNYEEYCPSLYLPIPTPESDAEVLIDVTTVSDDAAEVFPLGEFMVDNFEQCKAYIGILAGLVKPTKTTKENLYKKLPKYMYFDRIPDLTTANTSDYITCDIGKEEGDPSGKMQFISVYSQKYSEE